MTPTLLSISEVAKRLGVSRGQVYRIFKDGLRFVQIGGIRRVSESDLQAYVDANTHQEAASG